MNGLGVKRWKIDAIDNESFFEKYQKAVTNSFNKLESTFISPRQYTSEDEEYTNFDPDDHRYIYNETGKILTVEDDITDLSDLETYFDVDDYTIRDDLATEISDAETEVMNSAFDDFLNSGGGGGSSSSQKIEYVRNEVKDSIGNWEVKEDGTAGVDAEFISPVISNLNAGIKTMHKVFDFIESDPYIHTSQPTGLHINIGTWKRDEIDKVDWLKFLIVYRAERVLSEFGRISNTYAPDKLEQILRGLEANNLAPLYQDIAAINKNVILNSGKYSSVNLSKLYSVGIIELRAPGNAKYETKGEYLEKEILRIGRALDIASDPEAYKKEYAAKLYKFLSTHKNRSSRVGETPLDGFFKKINAIAPDYKFLQAAPIIIYLITNSHAFDTMAADNNYNATVHRELITDLREFENVNGTSVIDLFDRYLNKYDADNKIRNTKFMRMIFNAMKK